MSLIFRNLFSLREKCSFCGHRCGKQEECAKAYYNKQFMLFCAEEKTYYSVQLRGEQKKVFVNGCNALMRSGNVDAVMNFMVNGLHQHRQDFLDNLLLKYDIDERYLSEHHRNMFRKILMM